METAVENQSEIAVPVDPEYVAQVQEIRLLLQEARRTIVQLVRKVIAFRDSGIWKKGPWQSFERCAFNELGISPQRIANIEAAMMRYGDQWVEKFGDEAAIIALRLPPNSNEESNALKALDEATKERGRPPSSEAAVRIIAKFVPEQRPINSTETEEDRLRKAVRRLQDEITELKKKLVLEARARANAEMLVAKLKKRIAGGGKKAKSKK